MENVSETDFELYKDAVNSAYRLHDLLLGRLLQLAGPDTTVIILSDHGFHSDLLRPRVTPSNSGRTCDLASAARNLLRPRAGIQTRRTHLRHQSARCRTNHVNALRPAGGSGHGRPGIG